MKKTLIRSLTIILLFCSTVIYATNDQDKTMIKDYAPYMEKLIHRAKYNPEQPYAAMIIDSHTGEILSIGLNMTNHNPTYHAEMVAIEECIQNHSDIDWKNTVLITTAEPCPMCMSAVVWTGIPKVVYGTSIQKLEQLGRRQINISAKEVADHSPANKIQIIGGVLHQKTDQLYVLPHKDLQHKE